MRMILAAALTLGVMTACGSGKSSGGGSPQPSAAAEGQATPDCHGESPVWGLTGPKVYLLPEDRLYGKTKHGEYLCLSQAESQGYRHGRRPRHRRHHNQGAFSS
jgi:hypothetical protein